MFLVGFLIHPPFISYVSKLSIANITMILLKNDIRGHSIIKSSLRGDDHDCMARPL